MVGASPAVVLTDDNIVTSLIVDSDTGVGIYGKNVTGFDIHGNTIVYFAYYGTPLQIMTTP